MGRGSVTQVLAAEDFRLLHGTQVGFWGSGTPRESSVWGKIGWHGTWTGRCGAGDRRELLPTLLPEQERGASSADHCTGAGATSAVHMTCKLGKYGTLLLACLLRRRGWCGADWARGRREAVPLQGGGGGRDGVLVHSQLALREREGATKRGGSGRVGWDLGVERSAKVCLASTEGSALRRTHGATVARAKYGIRGRRSVAG